VYTHLALLAGFALIYSVVAGRIERMPLSGPIVFTAFGLAFGPVGFGLLSFRVNDEGLRTLAELTLALVLFTDAAGADLAVLRRSQRIPRRLLLVGLPLTILAGLAIGRVVFPGLTLFEAGILATMLAPTDAALGSAVVTNPQVPAEIREGLNVESGLNDGICVPILLLFLALATGATTAGGELDLALRLFAEEIGIGLAVGLMLAALGSWMITHGSERGWITGTWRPMIVVALSLSCFGAAQALGGSGFIASFCGGLLFGSLARKHKNDLLRTAEGTGGTLALVTWVAFGAAVVGQTMASFRWPIVVYALLSLTVIRMLPVFLSLVGTGVRAGGRLFIGWFGPRGLASIVFIIIVLDKGLPGSETLALAVVCTITLSILLHGFSANPLVTALGAGKRAG